jgi:hypothetical protein
VPVEYRVRVHYTEPMVRQSVRTFVRRTFFRGRLAAILVLVAVIGLAYFQAERHSGTLSFSAGLFVASLLLFPSYIFCYSCRPILLSY